MLEILIDNKNGTVWDISNLVAGITWKTSRIGRPASVDVTFIKGSPFQTQKVTYKNGDVIRIRKGNANVFYGYIFKIDGGKDEAVSITAYDQLRYLLANDTYVFANATATQIVRQIANDFELNIGDLADTSYRIPALVEDNKKLLDIICKALDKTLIATGRNYIFYDDFGKLAIRDIEQLTLPFVIGDESLLVDYKYSSSIDDDTYNRIKLVQDNKETGKREVYIAQDSANRGQWGLLQFYHSVDENLNAAQINEMLTMLIELKNRESRKIRLEAIGDIRVRAGCYLWIYIAEYNINQYFLVDECTHKIEGDDHIMSIELKVV